MTTIRVPTASELRERLDGIDRLLTARKWERAAIVYAFTDIGGPRNSGREKPDPPKLNIRDFAGQGYAGLTTNKSVTRYRDAWLTAISNGWAVPVEPGQEVTLPDEEFPAWPYGTAEADYQSYVAGDDEPSGSTYTVTEAPENVEFLAHRHGARGNYNERRPMEERVLAHLDAAAKALGRLSEIPTDDMDERMRAELVDRLTELQKQTRSVLSAIRGRLASV